MKFKNIIISLFMIVISLFATSVKADVRESFNVRASDLHNLGENGIPYYITGYDYNTVGVNMKFKKNEFGEIIYCTQMHHLVVGANGINTLKYTLDGEISDPRILYVLEHGYNGHSNGQLFGNADKDYLTTGLAVWYLMTPNDSFFSKFNLKNGTYNGNKSDVIAKMAELLNGANNYKKVNPTLELTTDSNNLTLSSDGKYFVSSKINVKKTGKVGDYKISLVNAPAGAVITDENNNSFVVKVPVSSVNGNINFDIKVEANGTVNNAYLYTPANSAFQNVAVLYPTTVALSKSLKLNANLTTEVQISKVDATTSEELEGAHLVVKNSDGKVIDEWTSTKEVHIIKGLKPGKYTLTETIAPDGYILSQETITFEVKAGSVTKVEMKNYLEGKPVPVTISKRDITTGEELAGAHLELRDENGEIIYAWISTEEAFVIEEGLAPGKYTLTEVIAPDGYELSTETVEFTVNEDGTVNGEVVMYNKPETIVDVPSTSSFRSYITFLIGLIVIGLGSLIIYRNYKKNEK